MDKAPLKVAFGELPLEVHDIVPEGILVLDSGSADVLVDVEIIKLVDRQTAEIVLGLAVGLLSWQFIDLLETEDPQFFHRLLELIFFVENKV